MVNYSFAGCSENWLVYINHFIDGDRTFLPVESRASKGVSINFNCCFDHLKFTTTASAYCFSENFLPSYNNIDFINVSIEISYLAEKCPLCVLIWET